MHCGWPPAPLEEEEPAPDASEDAEETAEEAAEEAAAEAEEEAGEDVSEEAEEADEAAEEEEAEDAALEVDVEPAPDASEDADEAAESATRDLARRAPTSSRDASVSRNRGSPADAPRNGWCSPSPSSSSPAPTCAAGNPVAGLEMVCSRSMAPGFELLLSLISESNGSNSKSSPSWENSRLCASAPPCDEARGSTHAARHATRSSFIPFQHEDFQHEE